LRTRVAPEAKDLARAQAVQTILAGGFGGRELVVRVNGLDTPWGAVDLEAIAAAGPDAVLVPKVNDADDIARYDDFLKAAAGPVRLWAMIETARCLFRLDQIAAASGRSRLSVFVMGTNDLAKEMGAVLTTDRAPFTTALSLSVASGPGVRLGRSGWCI